MRIERYYDVRCDYCGRHLSSDFAWKLCETSREAESAAKFVGFSTKSNLNICPCCKGVIFEHKNKIYKVKIVDSELFLQQKVNGKWNKGEGFFIGTNLISLRKNDLIDYAKRFIEQYAK